MALMKNENLFIKYLENHIDDAFRDDNFDKHDIVRNIMDDEKVRKIIEDALQTEIEDYVQGQIDSVVNQEGNPIHEEDFQSW